MPKRIDLIGKKFGRLTVINEYGRNKRNEVLWECKCTCGNIKITTTRLLHSGTKSCGCLRKEKTKEMMGKRFPNKIKIRNHPLHSTWYAMKARCYNKNHHSYKNYGGRGIRVSKSWYHSFEQFVKDMGPKPSKNHTIERIDNNKGYCKSNCKWVTRKEQANNKRNNTFRTYKGERLSLAEWARRLKVKYIMS